MTEVRGERRLRRRARQWSLQQWARLLVVVVTATAVLVVVSGGSRGVAAPTSQWWKTDLHDHSVISADAFPDLGIMAKSAIANHFNAIFLTDHNLGSNFAISSLTANHMTLDEKLEGSPSYFRRWTKGSDGSLSASTNAVSTADHFGSGSQSLLLSSTSSTTGENFAWTKRGPNLRSETGPIGISFAVKPTRLDSGSSLYVSASIGGDATADRVIGYTPASTDTPVPQKSTILIWYLGAAPPKSYFSTATSVYEFPLGTYTPNSWNTYTIDVRAALATLAAADVPLDYDALSDLKISALANGGTVTAYVDQYAIDAPQATAAGPNLAADEFVYRNTLIGQYATSNFQFFPGVEEGENEHAQRFDFDITSPDQFVNHQNGIDGISETQKTGYPAQLNHPGVSGGVSDAQATSTTNPAEGADLMEVRQQNMVDDWDTILRQNLPQTLIGTWGGDNHLGSWSGSSQATYIYAPSLDLDSLMHALFEGRAYVGTSSFTGPMSFDLGTSASAPYPARYPVYVAAGTNQNVHLSIASGLKSGSDTITWLTNAGSTSTTSKLPSETASAVSYDSTKSIPVSGASTYVRAEVRTSSTGLKGLTEPIVFRTVPGLPSDLSIHVDSVTPTSGCQCSLLQTQGITTTPTWNTTSKALKLTLENPAGSTVELLGTSATAPSSVTMDGKLVPASATSGGFDSATGDAWYFSAGTLYLQDVQGTASSTVQVNFGATDSTPPSIPTGLKATGASSSGIDLQWTASTDEAGGSGLAGYNVYRGTQKLNGSTPVTGTTFADTGLDASTQYTYTVTAVDNAGNESAPSTSAAGTTLPSSGGTAMFPAVADAYVDSSTSTNYGARTTLRVDTVPTVRSYLRFAVSGISGPVTSVQLKLHANTSQSKGFAVDALADDTWKESTILYTNAPTPGPQIGASGAVTGGSDVTVSLPTTTVSGNGDLDLVLAGLSTTAISLASRESTTPPQLIVTTSAGGGGGGGDTTKPDTPTGLAAHPVSATEVDLTWNVAQDNTGGSGIKGYNVYRDGKLMTSTPVSSTSYADKTVTGGNTYQYAVSSVDNAGNESALSGPVSATTPSGGGGGGGGTFTFTPSVDTYVDSSNAGGSYAGSTKLRVDGTPTVNSFLRFTLSGVTGTVTSVTLKVYATSSLAKGFAVNSVADNTWPETITYNTEPAYDGTALADSSAAVANSYVTVTLPASAVPASGDVSFALTALSTTALALTSSESANPPQLVVTTS